MATSTRRLPAAFDPAAYTSFRFLQRRLEGDGSVSLGYALEGGSARIEFTERIALPLSGTLGHGQIESARDLLSLLHWVAGVSYYKAALPAAVAFEHEHPGPAAVALLQALYSEGLGELAYRNNLERLPRPSFGRGGPVEGRPASAPERSQMPARVLVPVGGGKDSAVAIEVVRREAETVLFSVGCAPPIERTAAVAGLAHLVARRELDPLLFELNAAGAINGHVPITAIVSCIALLTAALEGFDAVAMANERSASAGNLSWSGVEVNHQFSKSLRAERLLSAAQRELVPPAPRCFSVLRPASELAIARGFARLERYHHAFTSCNAIFRIDPALRASSWCRDCPKCRFVYLALAPFTEPEHLSELFGADLLADEDQFEGFALLAASGGHKPFECVGEEQESLAAIRLLAGQERWRDHAVVSRLAAEVLAPLAPSEGDPAAVLAVGEDHDVPDALLAQLHALLRP